MGHNPLFFMADTTEEQKTQDQDTQTQEEQENPDKKDSLMNSFLNDTKQPPTLGDIVEGRVIAIHKSSVLVDIAPFGSGIIYGREYMNARDIIKSIAIGDEITGTIVDVENEDGYFELSLKEARQALIWGDAEKAVKEKKQFHIPIKEANKGGLILEWQGIAGFLPASQLSAEHYPRVDGGDKDRILEELQKLIGTSITVAIITADPKEGKLIFSEKGLEQKEKEVLISKYAVGDEVEGEITGIVDFGIFIKVQDGLEGLAHISELDWGLVEDPRKIFTVGQRVKAKVIEVKDDKISLSVKALKPNPWSEAAKKYTKDDTVQAVVIKYNKHGALASVEEGVAGLVHFSEF